MLKAVLRLGSELPLQSIVGVLGIQDGELGTDGPPRSRYGDVPDGTQKTYESKQRFTAIKYKI